MPSRRRREVELERVLGTPALFATAYGNVGSSIYYALGLTAVYALGLTPLVFLVAGVVFAMTAATYAEGTARYPEAGGSASFARHAFDELISFTAAWAQMLVYVVTVAVSAFFVPHYLSVFWEPLRTNPWDIVGGAVVIVILVSLNVVGVTEAAKLSISLAVIDFATQILLVILGFALVFSPEILKSNVIWGVAPTWSNLAISIPIAMLAYTGVETVSNLAEEARDPVSTVPNAYKFVAAAVFAIYFTLPMIALSALPVKEIDGEITTLLALPPEEGGYSNDPILGLVENLGVEGTMLSVLEIYVGILAATILFVATNAGVIGASRITYSMASYRQMPRDLSAAASEVQDSVALARRLRRDCADHHPASRRCELRRHALLASARPSRSPSHMRRSSAFGWTTGTGRSRRSTRLVAEPPPQGRRMAGLRHHRGRGNGRLVPCHRGPESGDAMGGSRLGRGRPDRLCRLPTAVPSRDAA